MQIKGKRIVNEKQFKENFDLEEVLSVIEDVIFWIQEKHFSNNVRKQKLLQLITKKDEFFDKDRRNAIFGIELDFDELAKDTDLEETYKEGCITLYQEMNKIKEHPIKLFCTVIGLYALADQELPEVNLIINIINNNKGLRSYISINETLLEEQLKDKNLFEIKLSISEGPYEIQSYECDAGEKFEIIPKKLTNTCNGKYSIILIHIISPEQKILHKFEIKSHESIYINTINGQFIQKSPDSSVGLNHIIYRFSTPNGNNTLSRSLLYTNDNPLEYNAEKLSDTTQFCADQDRGFIGIRQGKLVLYMNSYLEELFNVTSEIVWICLQGKLYMLLAKNGDVYSNFEKVKSWKGIIAIDFQGNDAVGVRWDGTVVTTLVNELHLNYKDAVHATIYDKNVMVYTNQGIRENGFPLLEEELNCQLAYRFKSGLITLDASGTVCLYENNDKKEKQPIFNNIREISVSDNYIAAIDKDGVIQVYRMIDRTTWMLNK